MLWSEEVPFLNQCKGPLLGLLNQLRSQVIHYVSFRYGTSVVVLSNTCYWCQDLVRS